MEILPCNFLLLLPLILLPLYFLITSKTRKSYDQNKPNFPPGPRKLPIIGNLHQLAKPPHESLSQLSKIYGPVMLLQFGSVPTVVISSAEAAEQVMKPLDLEFCTRPPLAGPKRLSYNYLDIAFVPYGEYWREIRKICVLELLGVKRVQSFKVVRAEEIDILIDSISSSSSSNISPVDVFEKLSSFTHKTICRVAFGSSTSLSTFDGRLTKILYEILSVLNGFSATDYIPKVGWIIDRISGSHGRIEKSFHDLDELFQRMIDEHLNPDIFAAGVDTTAVTMSWAMTELAKNPEAMKKVQEEIRNHVGSKGKVEESDLDHFPYLKMVVKETLRLHPVNPLILRESMKNSKIDGYDVYPKTTVLINAWAIGRNPKYWRNPEEFLPERFKDDSSIDHFVTSNQKFAYLPFGGGRRGCPGINMALLLTELVLANVLYAFDWELPKGLKKEDINMEVSSGISVHKKIPLELVPSKHIYG